MVPEKLTGTPICNGDEAHLYPTNQLAFAFDGNSATHWDSKTLYTGDNVWLGLLLPDVFEITHFIIKTEAQNRTPSQYSLRVSSDMVSWNTVQTWDGVTSHLAPQTFILATPISTQYVRINAEGTIQSSGTRWWVSDLEFYGQAVQTAKTAVILSTMPAALTRGFR